MSYLISLGAGLVVGLLYYFSRVQSPAPPLVALIGLLGMVIGEHAVPFVQAQWQTAQTSQSSAASANTAAVKADSASGTQP
ncbi:DUF1427 family protein [Paraburkholderia acidisoli]|uniref:DUF1427 family protein n=1 Tax=Paraburkholderia acidisoli TaxID=2571748 RepID=A0A7Z2GNB7_9BURK|nr:DUF1427 family protein [Paraburkholderia acidisoli]QGZ64966.1 DUF1427 family protein [Paraburkholderia acidisoli]